MKIKVIRTFFGAYLAICITYGALRTVIMPSVKDDNVTSPGSIEETTETVMYETEETGSTMTESTEESTAASKEEFDDDSSFEKRRRRKSWESEDDEETDITTRETETTTTVTEPSQTQKETEAEQEEDDKKKQTETTAAKASVPTLDDYLKKLRCGGCGRNCSLINPRCMRGARKESQAETEYYELYGQSAT